MLAVGMASRLQWFSTAQVSQIITGGNREADYIFPTSDDELDTLELHELGSQVGELQHYYVSSGSYLWTQGLHNCVDYAFFLFVGIVEGGGEVMATCFDSWGWG